MPSLFTKNSKEQVEHDAEVNVHLIVWSPSQVFLLFYVPVHL